MAITEQKSTDIPIQVVIQWLSGPAEPAFGRRIIVKAEPNRGFVIGRSPQSDWAITGDNLLSRHHVKIMPSLHGCYLTDLGSTNSTNVNNQTIQPHVEVELEDGDLVQVGRTVFRICYEKLSCSADAALVSEHSASPKVNHSSLTDFTASVTFSEQLAEQPLTGRVCSLCRRFVENPTPFVSPATMVLPHSVPMSLWVCTDCRSIQNQEKLKGDLAPHFETIRLLGRGAMGVVYLVRHRVTGRHVALKIINPETATSRTAIDRFLREMAVIGTLKHPHIVECLDQGHDDGQLWFAMEFVSGVSLENLAQANRGTYPWQNACRLICQVLKGLDHAHHLGFVHRDVKPENILIGRNSENKLVAKLSDFGLAKSYQSMGLSGLTFSGEMRGTVPFMPPEQMIDFKTVKPSADLYATAATLYYLIAGTYVFESEDSTEDMIQMLLDHKIVPLAARRSGLPAGLSDLLAKCLARNPEDRFQTAAEMRNALKPFT